jgi:hypothetical protein
MSPATIDLDVYEQSERKLVVCACFLLVAVSFLAYLPIWHAYFVGDDFAYIGLYAHRPFSDWWQIIATDWTKGIWGYQFDELRSMMALAFWWDGWLWAYQPFGAHLTNLFFHAGSSIVVFLLALAVFPREFLLALAAGLLFSLHPAHVEAVAWISGRADPICTFFSLLSLWLFVLFRTRRKIVFYLFSLAAFVVALFSKEIAIAFPLLPAGFDLFRRRESAKRWLKEVPALFGFLVVLAAYLQLRRHVFPHALRENVLNLEVVREFSIRQATYVSYLLPRVSLWLFPLLVAGGIAFALFRWKYKPVEGLLAVRGAVVFFGFWWYLVCVAPLIVTYSSPRHLYMTSVGICVLVPMLLRTCLPKHIFVIAIGCACALSATILLQRALQWRSAADISERARAEVEKLSSIAPAGSGLILNIPESIESQWLWLASLPFVLEPPYSRESAYRHFRVVERPATYQYWSGNTDGAGKTWIGDRMPILEDLAAHASDCYLLSLDKHDQIVITRIEGSEARRRLTRLVEILRQFQPTDSIWSFNAKWVSFWVQTRRDLRI